MNQVFMIGRLVRDPELRFIPQTGTPVARFSIAVDRPFAKKDAEVTADFFNVTVWNKRAETCCNYLRKGLKVAIRGRLQNNNYTDRDGIKRYNVEIQADEVEFLEWGDKKTQSSHNSGFDNPNYQNNYPNNSENYQNNNFSNQREDEFMPEGLDDEGYRSLSDDNVPF